MSKFESKFDIFTIDIHVILSLIVATSVYALLLKFLQKKFTTWCSNKGGGGSKAFWTMFKKLHFSYTMASLNCDISANNWEFRMSYSSIFNNLSVFLQIATHIESHYSYFVNKEAWIWQIRLNSWKFYPRSKIVYKSAICDKFLVCISGKRSTEKKRFLLGIARMMGGGGSTHARIFWPSF